MIRIIIILLGLSISGGIAAEQTICPVMEGNPIDKNLYVDYQGQRVYFCCETCVEEFQKNPEKYLPKLPQFQEASDKSDQNPVKKTRPFRQYAGTMGQITALFVFAAAGSGLFMHKNRKLLFVWHKRFGIMAVVSAVIHYLCLNL